MDGLWVVMDGLVAVCLAALLLGLAVGQIWPDRVTKDSPVFCPSCGQLSGFKKTDFVAPRPQREWHLCHRCSRFG